jgi:predicted tellurium resistance membrane protein TerC
MPNVRRFLLTACLCLLAALGINGVVRAVGEGGTPPGEVPAHPLKVQVEQPKQPTLDGTARFTSVKLRVPNGTLELDLSRVHSLTIETKDADVVTAAAELGDHSRIVGQLLTAELPVAVTGGEGSGDTRQLPIEPGLKVKFLHEKQTGLVAALIGLLTLTVMEIVLGIDNVIFLAIVAGKLPHSQQRLARRIGLAAALGTRLLLLCTLSFLMGLTRPLFTLPDLPFLHDPEARGISWRDLILLVGGMFLVAKSVKEIHEKIETARDGGKDDAGKKVAGFVAAIVQIAIIDIIFSLDSVITAVGMVEDLWVMIVAVIVAVVIMLIFAEPIAAFVDKNPTIKLLALSFLILIGVLLLAEGLGQHVDKGYIYFAMGFAVVIELLNMRLRPKPKEAVPAGENI